ncbi:MAG: hypothetical protein V4574_12690 [Pseudomonadota bacterium]
MKRALVLACAMLAAVPASAQDLETGSLVNRRAERPAGKQSDARAVQAWHGFASCMVRKRGESVRRLFDATTQAEVDKLDAAFTRELECLNTQTGSHFAGGLMLIAPVDVQRGMFAEALLDKMPRPLGLAPLARVPQYSSVWTAVSGRDRSVEEMAVCVAAINPAGIEALIATQPESRDELAAVRAVTPSLGTCLVANVRLTANRQSLRAALAEALYHRAMAPKAPAQ